MAVAVVLDTGRGRLQSACPCRWGRGTGVPVLVQPMKRFDIREVAEHVARTEDLAQQWIKERDTPARWRILREVYTLQMPFIVEARKKGPRGRIAPYFLDWDFTPIERNAWTDIRALGLPLYPQVPVGRYFLDFADPVLKIGVELDGRAFHSVEQDEPRDIALWEKGWRIFRIPGRDSFASKMPAFDQQWDEMRQNYPEVAERDAHLWIADKSEGFFWALSLFYYNRRPEFEQYMGAAYRALRSRTLVDFPLEISAEGDDESA